MPVLRLLFVTGLVVLVASWCGSVAQAANGQHNRGQSKTQSHPNGASYDGPAQLPIATVSSAMSDTPAPGSIITVNTGDDPQAALNNAHCGDTVELQAGATFIGPFAIPAKHCDSNHWIIVRSSSPDSALPTEG